MTPKEKAEELVIKMYQPLPASKEAVKGKEDLYYNQFSAAKQCALIAVDEILNSNPTYQNDVDWDDAEGSHPYYYTSQFEEAEKYWLEVKQEIEKL